jgi:S-formylglutathione hydrolase
MSLEKRSEQACFGGKICFYTHKSDTIRSDMRFAIYLPPQAARTRVPALYYLAGLTCNEETFMIKAGALRLAAEYGLALVAPDTSPRGLNIPGDSAAWDFGVGAGFYINATAAPWSKNYHMGSYVNEELPTLVEKTFPINAERRGIFGHSMGGHGALITALRNPARWHSLSAFAPISNPVAVPWGKKAFGNYLGPDTATWQEWDAAVLIARQPFAGHILVDQGQADQFLKDQLHPEALEEAAKASGQAILVRRHEGYDHSYWFIQTFIADHLAHHAKSLL